MRFTNNYTSKNIPKKTIYDFSVKDANNSLVSLNNYKSNVALVVNVASYWGLTNRNYEELQYLYKKYNSKGFVVIGFPSNQFGNQEPKSNKEIQEFAKEKGATFPIFGKIDVNGKNADPLYNFLKRSKRGFLKEDISWNFTKFLCVNGVPVKRYGPQENPKSFESDILNILNRNDEI